MADEPEKKATPASKLYDKKPTGEKKDAPREHADAPNDETGEAEGSDIDMEMKERKEVADRHEAERRDHHNGHRTALRDMEKRHSKEWKEMLLKQQTEMMPTEGAAPAAAAVAGQEGAAAPAAKE